MTIFFSSRDVFSAHESHFWHATSRAVLNAYIHTIKIFVMVIIIALNTRLTMCWLSDTLGAIKSKRLSAS